jgi:hypothetical protein
VGYKKHTLRLWLHDYRVGVLLVPLVSWAAPANVSEGGLLVPSLHYCQRQWNWCPPLIVADMGYLAAEVKRRCRERWHVAVLTKLRSDMRLVPPYVDWNQAACPQGEPLAWLGYDGRADEHWFGTGARPELCDRCWEAVRCPRQFAYRPEQHETLLGLLPLASPTAQRVLQRVRPWIEPAQSFEKNQLARKFHAALRFSERKLRRDQYGRGCGSLVAICCPWTVCQFFLARWRARGSGGLILTRWSSPRSKSSHSTSSPGCRPMAAASGIGK